MAVNAYGIRAFGRSVYESAKSSVSGLAKPFIKQQEPTFRLQLTRQRIGVLLR
jgi:hypothetical protein